MQKILEIEKLVPGGLGLARTGDGVVLVRGGLPGEKIEAEITKKKNHLEAEVISIIEESPLRYKENLPPSADLPLVYEAQLEAKQSFVSDSLGRIAKQPNFEVSAIQASPLQLHYRTSAQYALHPTGGMAYRAPRTNDLIRITKDPLVTESLQKTLDLLTSWPFSSLDEIVLRSSLYSGKTMVGLIGGRPKFFKQTANALVDEGVAGVVWAESSPKGRFRATVSHLAGDPVLLEDFGGVISSVNVQSFAQVNPKAAGLLYLEAKDLIGKGQHAVELYSGNGTLSFHIAENFDSVTAIEINRDAVNRGQLDKKRLGVENVNFVHADASHLEKQKEADVIIVDPPRAGLTPDVLQALLTKEANKIIYIACDPATWARDVGNLCRDKYQLEFVRPYDFYPFTHHVEVLSVLTLK